MFLAGLLLAAVPVSAQNNSSDCESARRALQINNPNQLPPCSASSDEDRRARAEARAEEKAERDAQKRADKQAKEAAKERARQQAEAERQAALEAQRQREMEAARQRQLAIEAQRLQSAFNELKPAAVNDLKGVDGSTTGTGLRTGGLELKGLDDASHSATQPAWDAKITDPEVAVYARRLDSIVPPPPIPAKEVALNWKQIYLNDDRLMDTTDVVVTAWEMTGVLGEKLAGPVDWFIIFGKIVIADENGAYLHLVNNEKDYDAALAYLKNPSQSQQFAHLVQDLRKNRPLPAAADAAMVKAARAITDPKLGNSGAAIALDSMVSKEALGALVRKAAIELVSKKLGDKAEDVIKDMNARKAMYEAVRVEREEARKMMILESTTKAQRAQWQAVIDYANQLTAKIYRIEKAAYVAGGYDIGEATDQLAEEILGSEATGREY